MSKINQTETKSNGMRQVIILQCTTGHLYSPGLFMDVKTKVCVFCFQKVNDHLGKKLYTNKHVLLFYPNIFHSYLLDPSSAVHTFVSAVQVYPFINPSAGCRATRDLHMNCVPKGDHFFCLIVIICFVSAYTVLEYFKICRNK